MRLRENALVEVNLTRRRETDNKYPAKTVVKALRILEHLGTVEHGDSITEISQKLRIGKSTVYRLLATLSDHDFVWLDPYSGHYILGAKLLSFTEYLSQQSTLIRYGSVTLDDLSKQSNETCNMGVLDGYQVLYLMKKDGVHPLRMSGQVGRKLPAHCTALGKVLLSGLSEEELASTFKHVQNLETFTPNTISNLDTLKRQLVRVRDTGLALDNEELYASVMCLAAPVRDFSGRIIAAISISFPKFRMDPDKLDDFKSLLISSAEEFSRQLGYKPHVTAEVKS